MSSNHCKESILETMKRRPIISDGSYVLTLEKRGYVLAGCWTPECVLEYPNAVSELHTEFLRAGADVIQAFSFHATEGRLSQKSTSKTYTSSEINDAASKLAHAVADPAGAWVCGGLSPTPTYNHGNGDMTRVYEEFQIQVTALKRQNVDFLLGEFYGYLGEAEIAVKAMKESDLPVAVTLRIGPTGDHDDIDPAECAVRLSKAGADIIGINCCFDPETCLKTIEMMKIGLENAGLEAFLMVQPVGFHCPEMVDDKEGYHHLPEYPFALEPRQLTRFDARGYARKAYEMGVRYIGGCCGFESRHLREMAEELAFEIGHRPLGQGKNGLWGSELSQSGIPASQAKNTKDYWSSIVPGTGRSLLVSAQKK